MEPGGAAAVTNSLSFEAAYVKSHIVHVGTPDSNLNQLMKPRSAASQRRAEKKLSAHAVANTWFDPGSLPSWLNEEYYSQEVQPKLKLVLVRELASAIGVSKPYAAQIRSGKTTPHPRHWQKLAEIVGLER